MDILHDEHNYTENRGLGVLRMYTQRRLASAMKSNTITVLSPATSLGEDATRRRDKSDMNIYIVILYINVDSIIVHGQYMLSICNHNTTFILNHNTLLRLYTLTRVNIQIVYNCVKLK